MKITFDLLKRNKTLEERGLDMARALEIFDGTAVTRPDDRKNYGEQRFITVGYLDQRMVVLVWTKRSDVLRIISLRKANEREQKIFAPRMD
jgi:uncharacterized DUF497 family protein